MMQSLPASLKLYVHDNTPSMIGADLIEGKNDNYTWSEEIRKYDI